MDIYIISVPGGYMYIRVWLLLNDKKKPATDGLM